MRLDIDIQKDYIISQLKSGTPQLEICRELNCKWETLNSRLKAWRVSHLKNPGRRGAQRIENYIPAENYLSNRGTMINSHDLKKKIIRDGIKEHKCEKCNNSSWNELPIPLELHHVNGDRFDNRLENLQLLCPNCHAQEPNNSGAGRNSSAKVQKMLKRPRCSDCGKQISYSATKCKSCTQSGKTKIDWPSYEELLEMVKSTNFSAVGRKLGVSDNAVRKRLAHHSHDSTS